VPDTAGIILASWDTEPRLDVPLVPWDKELRRDDREPRLGRATEKGRTVAAVRLPEAVRVINGPSCPAVGTIDLCRLPADCALVELVSVAVSRANGSPPEVVREKEAVLRRDDLRQVIMCGDGTVGSAVLWSGWWCWALDLGFGIFTLIPRVDVGLWRLLSFVTAVARLERPHGAFRNGQKPLLSLRIGPGGPSSEHTTSSDMTSRRFSLCIHQ